MVGARSKGLGSIMGCRSGQEKVAQLAAVRLPDGSLLTRSDLPPRETRRWVASRKLMVVRGVLYHLITQQEALDMYDLSAEEFLEWVEGFRRRGIAGLRAGTAHPDG